MIVPIKKCIPAGTPSFGGTSARNFSTPVVKVKIAIASGISISAQS